MTRRSLISRALSAACIAVAARLPDLCGAERKDRTVFVGPAWSIADAIANAKPGDTIIVPAGYGETMRGPLRFDTPGVKLIGNAANRPKLTLCDIPAGEDALQFTSTDCYVKGMHFSAPLYSSPRGAI